MKVALLICFQLRRGMLMLLYSELSFHLLLVLLLSSDSHLFPNRNDLNFLVLNRIFLFSIYSFLLTVSMSYRPIAVVLAGGMDSTRLLAPLHVKIPRLHQMSRHNLPQLLIFFIFHPAISLPSSLCALPAQRVVWRVR